MDWSIWVHILTVLGLLMAAAGLELGMFPGIHWKAAAGPGRLKGYSDTNKSPEPVIELPGHLKGTGAGLAATARKSIHAVAEPEPIVYGKDCTTISGSIPNPMLQAFIEMDHGEAERWYPELRRDIKPYGIQANGDVLALDERTGKEVVWLNGDGTHERIYYVA